MFAPTRSLCRFILAALVLALLFAPTPLRAQGTGAQDKPFDQQSELWSRTLTLIEVQLSYRTFWDHESLAEARSKVSRVASEAKIVQDLANAELASVDRLLKALGPVPEEGEEPEKIRRLRATHQTERDAAQTKASESGLVLAKAEELQKRLNALTQRERLTRLLTRGSLPFMPRTWQEALPAFTEYGRFLANAPEDWWEELSQSAQLDRLLTNFVIVILLVLLTGIALRHFIIKWFGRDPSIIEPSYMRRLAGALADGVSGGLLPALVFVGLLVWLRSDANSFDGLLEDALSRLCLSVILVIFAWSLPHAILAPGYASWALISVPDRCAKVIARRVLIVAIVFAFDLTFRVGFSYTFAPEALRLVYGLFFISAASWSIFSLTSHHLWRHDPGLDETDHSRKQDLWSLLRRLVAVLAMIAFGASLLGYAALGTQLVYNILGSTLLIILALLSRGLLREVIGLITSSQFLQSGLRLKHSTRSLLKFWLRTLVDLLLVTVTVMHMAAIWASSLDEVWYWTSRFLQGFTVGEVTISLADIFLALVVFSLVLLLTRIAQRFLSERLLPQTGFDTGLSHSIAGGLGYIGVFLALALAVLVLGVDFTSIALIAGALSVGIGFGLQNIVNNFVSGIILLLERPVKVGDWVIVGPNEGTVKNINVRATEIETFQRASVIVPNAEFLSTAITNWTHKDRVGRIDVSITVGPDADSRLVERILLEIAQNHERVVNDPEPFVLFQDMTGEGATIDLRCFTYDVFYQFIIGSDIRHALHQRLREEAVPLAVPRRLIANIEDEES